MRIVIGEGSCGIAAGAAKVHKAIEALMTENESFTLGKMFSYLFKNKYLLIYYFGYFFYSAANISGALNLFVSYYICKSHYLSRFAVK